MLKNWKDYLDFLRPFTLLPPALGMMSGSFIALGHSSHEESWFVVVKICLGAFVAASLNGASNSLNQIYDLEIDKINKPGRPLPSGRITEKEAWGVTLTAYFMALVLSYCISLHCFWMVSLGAFFTVLYSVPPLRTKRHWLLAAITIAIPRGILLKIAGWTVLKDMYHLEPWYIGAIFGLFLLGANNTKDYADIKGDQAQRCQTLPIRFGIRKSIFLISPFFVFPFAFFPVGVFLEVLTGNPYLLWGLGISLMVWGVYVVHLLLKDPESLARTENHPSWTQMYMMMMYAQIALALSYIF